MTTSSKAISKHSLKAKYDNEVAKQLREHFGFSSPMQTPRLQKVVLNMGVGEAVNEKKYLDAALSQMTLIAGQKPVVTLARKSIAGFKIREDYPLGCKVTLRGHAMWDFMDRLIHVALPRVRDFRGLSPRSFDGFGNYAMGIKEQIVFPEIDFDKVDKIRGLDIVLATSAKNNEEGFELLKLLGLPFAQR